MFGFLSAIPVVGKIFDVVNNVTNKVSSFMEKKQDVEIEKYRVKGQIDVAAMKADTDLIQARVDLQKVRGGDQDSKFGRVLIISFSGMYIGSWMWWASFSNLLPKYLVWKPEELPTSMEYIPYAVIVYLFAVIIKNGLAK
jgi:hypothetical protein